MTEVGGLEARRFSRQLDGAYLTGFNERLEVSVDRGESEPSYRLLRTLQDFCRQQRIPRFLDQ